MTAGQAGDNPQLLPLLDDYRHASTEYALGSTDFRLLADKAYSHPSTRAALRSKKIKHTIPERHDQIDRRKAKGSAGGRPPAFDAALYGLRNTVERGFHRLKQWRGIATRYDKYALTYLGGVLLACAVIHARVGTPKLGDTRPASVHPGRDSARQTVALSSRSAPIGDYFSRAGRRSNSPGNAWLADSRMLIVALPDNGVGSGLTSITAVPRASARSGKPAAG